MKRKWPLLQRSVHHKRPFFMEDVAQSSGHASLAEQLAAADEEFKAMKEQFDQLRKLQEQQEEDMRAMEKEAGVLLSPLLPTPLRALNFRTRSVCSCEARAVVCITCVCTCVAGLGLVQQTKPAAPAVQPEGEGAARGRPVEEEAAGRRPVDEEAARKSAVQEEIARRRAAEEVEAGRWQEEAKARRAAEEEAGRSGNGRSTVCGGCSAVLRAPEQHWYCVRCVGVLERPKQLPEAYCKEHITILCSKCLRQILNYASTSTTM